MSKKPFFIHLIRLTYGNYLKIKYKMKKEGFDLIPKEGPFLVFANHTHLVDPFFISSVIDSHVRWVAGAYLFKNQILRILLTKLVGSIGKQQGRSDLTTITNIREALKQGDNVGIFPEGTRTWDGEAVGFDISIAKFVRLFKVPVVLINLEGSYAIKPRWATKRRKGPFIIRVVDVLYPEKIKELSIDELYATLQEKLNFSFSKWQKENQFVYKGNRKAERVENFLYICPACNSLSTIHSDKNRIYCSNCSLEATLNEYEELIFTEKQIVSSFSQWREWQIKTLTKDKEFPPDRGILLQRDIKGRLVPFSKKFYLTLKNDKLVLTFPKIIPTGILKGFKSLEFKFDDISSMIINAKGTVEFFNKGELWRIRIANDRSILKYVEWYETHYRD